MRGRFCEQLFKVETALDDPKWLALRPKERAKLLEEHRNWNVEDIEWWDHIFEGVVNDMDEIGVSVDKRRIFFTGFWSQGDGACFEFQVTNFQKFLAAVDPVFAEVALKIDTSDLEFQGTHSSRGCNSGCINYSTQLVLNNPYMLEGGLGDETDEDNNANWLQRDAWNLMTHDGFIIDDCGDTFKQFMRGKMDELYKDLEAEHDYQTSDEQVVESLLANDMLDEYLEARKEKHRLRCRAFN